MTIEPPPDVYGDTLAALVEDGEHPRVAEMLAAMTAHFHDNIREALGDRFYEMAFPIGSARKWPRPARE